MTKNELRREMNLREAVALGIGGTIGGGIFVLVGHAAGLAGPGVLLAFGLAFLASLSIALPYAELACRFPEAGGGYAFVRTVLGHRWGFLMGWGFWGGYLFISGYVTLGFGGYLHALTGAPPAVAALLLVLASTVIHLAGVKLSSRVQVVVVLLALMGLLGFAALGLPHVRLAQFIPWLPNGAAGLLHAALLAFLAFGGFDMVAAAGEEIRSPERNLPLAILLTLGMVLGVYLLVTYVALGTLSWEALGNARAPLAEAAQAFHGPSGASLVAVAALLTTAATAHAVLAVTSRISFAMARDGLLPAPLALVHTTTGVPWVAILVSSSMLVLVALSDAARLSTAIGGFLYVAHFMPPLLAVVRLRRREGPPPAFQIPAPVVLLPFAFGMCTVLLVSSGWMGVLGGLGWFGVGVVVRPIVAVR